MDSDSEKEMIHALRQALSTVAVVASLSIMYIYARFPDMRNWSYTMVLLMTLCGTGGNLADLIVVDDSRLQDTSFMCYVQGVAGQFFDLSSALWAGAICYSLYTVVVLEHRLEAPFKRSCHAFVWGLSVVLMLLPFTTSSYGMAGQWCWIKAPAGDKKDFSTDDGTIWRLVCFYIPIWATIMSISVLYYKISMTLKNYVRVSEHLGANRPGAVEMKRLSDTLFLFPLIYACSWSVATACRFYHWANPAAHHTWLSFIQATVGNGSAMQALGNALVYNASPAVKKRWAEVLGGLWLGGGCVGEKNGVGPGKDAPPRPSSILTQSLIKNVDEEG